MSEPGREAVARAIAFFEGCDDVLLLHRLSSEIAPRARRAVNRLIARHGEDGVPAPSDIRAAREAADETDAVATVRATEDFALLQALARAIGRRAEDIETVASAEFAEGTRVSVPASADYPPTSTTPTAMGVVERTGTWLRVRLDSGETWEGPPSLAHKGGLP